MDKSEHHIIPKHGEEIIGLNVRGNRKVIPHKKHVNHHAVFQGKEFHRQVLYLLDFSIEALKEGVIRDVEEIMNLGPEYIYKDGLYIPRNY